MKKLVIPSILILTVLIGGAYLLGQSSKNSTNPQPQEQNIQRDAVDSSTDLTASSNNGLACKSIAEKAVEIDNQNPSKGTSVVLKSHFNRTLNECFYEVNITGTSGSGFLETDIRSAPNDDWVAYCAHSSPNYIICNARDHQGLITEDDFKMLEVKYLEN